MAKDSLHRQNCLLRANNKSVGVVIPSRILNTTVTVLQNSWPSEQIIQSNIIKPENHERQQCVRLFPYIFETSVKRLKLLPGELGLGLQLVEALWLVAHHGELQVAFTGVCPGEKANTGEEREEDRRKPR